MTATINDLSFVRLKVPRLIPRILIENVKGRTFTADQFYEYQDRNLKNPFNYLYALIDDQKKIHGFIWCQVNDLDNVMFINTFSIDKEYWHKGAFMPKVCEFLGGLKESLKCPTVWWMTSNEKFFKKYSFRKSKICLMEYN